VRWYWWALLGLGLTGGGYLAYRYFYGSADGVAPPKKVGQPFPALSISKYASLGRQG
jgi:hypothetical protein